MSGADAASSSHSTHEEKAFSLPRGSVGQATNKHTVDTTSIETIRIIFSDIDGTLVHYPDGDDDMMDLWNNTSQIILPLPPSSTGRQGIISHQTLRHCEELRRRWRGNNNNNNIQLVLISGMRTTTLLKRLPFLPKADAYCCEAGGRIFYPCEPASDDLLLITPEPFVGAGDLSAFALFEDLEWRQGMQTMDAAGYDGYRGAEQVETNKNKDNVHVSKRQGSLWQFARDLAAKGLVLDTRGYATCFRVNRQQQTEIALFDKLLQGKLLPIPDGLATSVNLGCIDYYPKRSGKKNCCEYLAAKFSTITAPITLADHCLCLCDDDNDLDMALACRHAYLPAISSDSMRNTLDAYPNHFSAVSSEHMHGTVATDRVLAMILERVTRIERSFE